MNNAQHDYLAEFLNVSQGDATLISQLPQKYSVLIDAAITKPVILALRHTTELKAIFVTHWDADHISGMPGLIRWLSDQHKKDVRFFVNRQQSDSNIAKRLRRSLDEASENGTINLQMAYRDFPGVVKIIGGTISILWPTHESGVLNPADRNLDSLVLRFDAGAFQLLLGGDAKGSVWPNIKEQELPASVFRYPHHGGRLLTSDKN